MKLDASMALLPSANRHSTELAANAINASTVQIIVFDKELLVKCSSLENRSVYSPTNTGRYRSLIRCPNELGHFVGNFNTVLPNETVIGLGVDNAFGIGH